MGNADDTIAAILAQRLKPHDLAQQVERAARTVSPADLPVFYDLAARELIRLGDYKRAATQFANARTAESAPGAPPVADSVWLERLDVRVLETCLPHGVPVADPTGQAWLDLDLWMRGRRPEDDLSATVQDPRFAPQVLAWARKGDAARLWSISALRPYLTPPREAASAPHPLDGPKIYSAVHEFGTISAMSSRAVPRLLYSLRLLTKSVREGTADTVDHNLLHLGETADLAGRIE